VKRSRKSFWLKQLHTWHWMSSAISLVGLLLFAITGFTLNHAADIEATPKSVERAAQLPPPLLALVKADDKPDSKKPLPAAVARFIESKLPMQADGVAEWSADEIYLAKPRPGGDGWISIDRETGKVTSESSSRGWIAYLNDLHKGRNAGGAWKLFIDIFVLRLHRLHAHRAGAAVDAFEAPQEHLADRRDGPDHPGAHRHFPDPLRTRSYMQFRLTGLTAAAIGAGSLFPAAAGAQTLDLTVTFPSSASPNITAPMSRCGWRRRASPRAPSRCGTTSTRRKGGEGTKWLRDIRQWWRASGRTMTFPADGVSGATRAPGTQKLRLVAGRGGMPALTPGNYTLVVEAAREVGGRELVRLPFAWNGNAATASGKGASELGAVAFALKR
jgi:hypothetical protein